MLERSSPTLCERVSADRACPGFVHTSSSSDDVDAMCVRLSPRGRTGRISTERRENGEGVRQEIINTIIIIIYTVTVYYSVMWVRIMVCVDIGRPYLHTESTKSKPLLGCT